MATSEKFKYKVSIAIHFIFTFLLVSFAIVSLVQGIKLQFLEGSTLFGFLFYFATPVMVFVSYLTYRRAHYKLDVIAMSRN